MIIQNRSEHKNIRKHQQIKKPLGSEKDRKKMITNPLKPGVHKKIINSYILKKT